MTDKELRERLYTLTVGKFTGLEWVSGNGFKLSEEGYAELARTAKNALRALDMRTGSDSGWPYNMLEDCCYNKYEYNWDTELYEDTATIQNELSEDRLRGIEHALETLTERERDCLVKYYRDGRSYKDIAKDYQVTQERIRQVIAKALRKLRYPTRRKFLLLGYKIGTGEVYREEREKVLEELRRARTDAKEKFDKMVDGEEEEKGVPISDMELSMRSWNCLRRAGFETAEQVAEKVGSLRSIRNLGRRSEEEILAKLREMHYIE